MINESSGSPKHLHPFKTEKKTLKNPFQDSCFQRVLSFGQTFFGTFLKGLVKNCVFFGALIPCNKYTSITQKTHLSKLFLRAHLSKLFNCQSFSRKFSETSNSRLSGVFATAATSFCRH